MLKRSGVYSVSLTSGVHVAVNWKWSFIDYKKVRENNFRGVFYFQDARRKTLFCMYTLALRYILSLCDFKLAVIKW